MLISGKSVQSSVVVSAASLSPIRALTTVARYQPIRVTEQAEIGKIDSLPLPAGQVKTGRYQVVQSDSGGLSGRFLRWCQQGIALASSQSKCNDHPR